MRACGTRLATVAVGQKSWPTHILPACGKEGSWCPAGGRHPLQRERGVAKDDRIVGRPYRASNRPPCDQHGCRTGGDRNSFQFACRCGESQPLTVGRKERCRGAFGPGQPVLAWRVAVEQRSSGIEMSADGVDRAANTRGRITRARNRASAFLPFCLSSLFAEEVLRRRRVQSTFGSIPRASPSHGKSRRWTAP